MKRYLNLGVILLFFIVIGLALLFFSVAAIAFAAMIVIIGVSILVVPTTWVVGIFTSQSYDRVCDNSEIVYRLNKIGKWSLIVSMGGLLTWGVYSLIF